MITADPAAALAARIAAPLHALGPEPTWVAAALLADHAWCVAAAGTCPDPGPPELRGDGVTELAARQAAQGQWADLDDVHWGALVHPGAVIWPVVVRLGTAAGAPGSRWLAAALAGYAVIVRQASAYGLGHAERFHVTATAGPAGVVAAAARLLGHDAATTATALRHAWSLAGGARGALADPAARTRVVHRAHAVRTGLTAVAAAPGLPAAPTGALLDSGVFRPGFAEALDTGPIGSAELAATRPRYGSTTGLDPRELAAAQAGVPITAAALAAKWGRSADGAAAVVRELAAELAGAAVPSWRRIVERMADPRRRS